MWYVIFSRDWPRPGKCGACGMTAWTKHAFDRKSSPEWKIEPHDDWPEQGEYPDLLTMTPIQPLPEHVGGLTVDNFLEKYYGV